MLSVPRTNWEKGIIERVAANEAGVQKLVDFLYGSKRWEDDLESVVRKVRTLRAEIYPSSDTPPMDGWEAKVRQLVTQKPKYWTPGRLAAHVAQPVEEVERVLSAIEAAA